MKLIIMHSRGGSDVNISIHVKWLVVAACVLLLAAMALGAVLQRVAWSSYSQSFPAAIFTSTDSKVASQDVVQAMAVRLGELQASVARLDGLGRRVAEVAGLPQDQVAIVKDIPEAMVVLDDILAPAATELGLAPVSELERQISLVQANLARQTDYFSMLDLSLTRQLASLSNLPTAMPIESYPYLSSSYGWRRHPFNGQISMHEGLDFSAPQGTPIIAAAGGVVRTVTQHSGYGNMLEIDHGEGLITRYAHAQSILVSEGQLVTRGQLIAKVGSTGLSTGPHLHFEVRKNEKALDPRLFLAGQPLPGAIARAPTATTSPGVTWRPRLR